MSNKLEMETSLAVDKYFLSVEAAYQAAEMRKVIREEDGTERLQYCYYDGPLTDIPLENFIQVAQNDFVEFFSNNTLPVPSIIVYESGDQLDLSIESSDIFDEINLFRENLKVTDYVHKDTYFIDAMEALNVAKQKNRVACNHPFIDGLQVCYYHGEAIAGAESIHNLINVSLNELIEFFTFSQLRIFSEFRLPDGLDIKLKTDISNSLKEGIEQAISNRNAGYQQLANQAKRLQPNFDDEIKRVFLSSSRLTTVMQYCSKNVADSFRRMGFEVLFEIESNEMEERNPLDFMQKFVNFNPHITFNINHLQNAHIADNVINIVWWQDVMPYLIKKDPYQYRQNDLHLVYTNDIENYVTQKGITQYYKQLFCVDESIFYPPKPDSVRENKIVFVGGSGGYHVQVVTNNEQKVLTILNERFSEGTSLSDEFVEGLIKEHQVSKERMDWLTHFVHRFNTVKWICTQDEVESEVYGYYWDFDEDISPHYQGPIEHGEKLADLYRTTKYALVVSDVLVTSQRLIEVIACGCIPIVYDSREYCNYDNEFDLIYFKTEQELNDILSKGVDQASLPAIEHYTYSHMVKKLLGHISLESPPHISLDSQNSSD